MWPFKKVEPFKEFTREAFAFLETEFGFHEPLYRVRRGWEDEELSYQNSTTGVTVTFERSYPGVFVKLSRRRDTDSSEEFFYLEDLVKLHAPSEVLAYDLPRTFDDAQYRNEVIQAMAELTRKHSESILKGDFSDFLKLAEIRAQRGYRQLR